MTESTGQFRVVFSPKDFEAARAFYRDGLALEVDHEWDYGGGDKGIVFLAASGMIELLGLVKPADYAAPQGIGVLIQVDDADRWHVQAQTKGLRVVQPPTDYPWGHRVLRLADPDGLVVSLFSLI